MTDCPDCRWAEAKPSDRLILAAIAIWKQHRAGPFDGIAGVLRAGLGHRERTWYEKHRDRWVFTGNEAELARMLRHVR
jgi:hypothetical protein